LTEDTYASSLIHVNRLYSKMFGTEARKVPAHVPHMIDRDIMAEMQATWPIEVF
jgi:UDP-N-acetylglucosamine-lysosomal-enzyme